MLLALLSANNIYAQRIIWERTMVRDISGSSTDNIFFIDSVAGTNTWRIQPSNAIFVKGMIFQ
jgi:hypothetical protein